MLIPPHSVGLYIHIPWCARKCPYCDFNSHQARQPVDQGAYVQALLRDLDHQLAIAPIASVNSIFFGGGTPSLFDADQIDTILTGIRQRLSVSADCEITLEANPGTAERAQFSGYYQAGVNRLSIGIQSFDDVHLKALGRIHDSDSAHQAIQMAHSAGFQRVNLDLMFGLPQQTLDQAIADVEQALAYNTGHLSYYQLTLEPNTLFYRHPPTLPNDDALWDIQQAGQQLITGHYPQYEISAFAVEGQACRHNLNYWQFGDYVGVGAGAHSKITRSDGSICRSWRLKHPERYQAAAGTAEAIGGSSNIAQEQLPFEFMMNGLRLKSGILLKDFETRTGLDPLTLEPVLKILLSKGLIKRERDTLCCSRRGWNYLNEVLETFLPHDSP